MSRMYTQTPLNFRIIGFDPGYDRMGISVLDHKNGREFLIYSACFETNKKMGFADRLVEIDGAVQSAIKTWEPKVAALETLFFSKNVKTALKVAEVRGIIISGARGAGLSVVELSPAAVKIAVTGYGAASKSEIAKMIPKIFAINHEVKHDDEYDAIAVAYAGSMHYCLSTKVNHLQK